MKNLKLGKISGLNKDGLTKEAIYCSQKPLEKQSALDFKEGKKKGPIQANMNAHLRKNHHKLLMLNYFQPTRWIWDSGFRLSLQEFFTRASGKYLKGCVPRVRSRAAFEKTTEGFDERGQQTQNCNLKTHQFIMSLVRKGVFPPLKKKLFFPSPSRTLCSPFILSDQIHPLGKHRRD